LELRDENQRYRAYLDQRKFDEQRQQIELDRILQAELDRQNAKRLEKVHAEKDKRAKLLQEVIEGRQQQLLERSMIFLFFFFLTKYSFCIFSYFNLDERKAQDASEYQWQKDTIKTISEQNRLEEADREARNRTKRLAYRQDLFGQMNYEQRKKQEVQLNIHKIN
jgi:hypothetical protein